MHPKSEGSSLCFVRMTATSHTVNLRQVIEDSKWLITISFQIKQFINFAKWLANSETTTKSYGITWLESLYLWVKAFGLVATGEEIFLVHLFIACILFELFVMRCWCSRRFFLKKKLLENYLTEN